MKILISSLIVFVLFLFHSETYAWGVTGHRVIAEIAQHHLSKKATKGIKEIIGKESLSFWSNWPDFIKSDTTHTWDNASKWHYVDLPGNMEKQVFIDSLKSLKGANLYTQIPLMEAQVKDKLLPMEARRNALAFLIHFIGDLHQPLHVGRDENQGGNKISLYWFEKKTNLHALWDSELINFQQYSYTEFATNLDVKDKAQVQLLQNSSLEDWFYESHVLSDKIYLLSPAESKLSYKYNYIFEADLESQLLKGGVRLAKVLNDIFE